MATASVESKGYDIGFLFPQWDDDSGTGEVLISPEGGVYVLSRRYQRDDDGENFAVELVHVGGPKTTETAGHVFFVDDETGVYRTSPDVTYHATDDEAERAADGFYARMAWAVLGTKPAGPVTD